MPTCLVDILFPPRCGWVVSVTHEHFSPRISLRVCVCVSVPPPSLPSPPLRLSLSLSLNARGGGSDDLDACCHGCQMSHSFWLSESIIRFSARVSCGSSRPQFQSPPGAAEANAPGGPALAAFPAGTCLCRPRALAGAVTGPCRSLHRPLPLSSPAADASIAGPWPLGSFPSADACF